MTIYKAPLDDMRFALYDVLGAEAVLARLEGGEGHTRDLLDAVLEEAARFNEQVLAPLNAPGDEEGCHFDKATRTVTTPKGFKEAYRQYAEGGWAGLTAHEKYGGQALPAVLGTLTKEMIDSANLAWGIYPCSPTAPPAPWSTTRTSGSRRSSSSPSSTVAGPAPCASPSRRRGPTSVC